MCLQSKEREVSIMEIIPTNKMITEVVNKYGIDSREAIKMRLTVVSYKGGGTRTYQDCLETYKKLMRKA